MEEKFTGDVATENNVNSGNASVPQTSDDTHGHTSEHHGEHSHSHSGSDHSHSSHHSHSSSHHSHSGSHHGSGSHHSHGSHHSSSHRSYHSTSHRSHHGKKRSVFKRFKSYVSKLFKNLKNSKNRVSIICSLILIFVILLSISFDVADIIRSKSNNGNDDYIGENGNLNDSTNDNTQPSDVLNVELLNSDGIMVTEPVMRYMRFNILDNTDMRIQDFADMNKRYDVEVPISLKLSTTEGDAVSYKIEYADNARFDNVSVDYLDASSGTYSFRHLKSSTKYYYRVTAYTANGIIVNDGTFETADFPRLLSIDGIYNVRDIGNWKTDTGARIKQGLLIRGTELDGAEYSAYHLTTKGVIDMLDTFKFKLDMDLRNEADTPFGKDALGAGVEHKYYNSPMYAGIFEEEGKAIIYSIFKDLANPINYPIYLHCTYGCDRTGTVCYLLEALLGVSRVDCIRDYGLSNLDINKILAVEDGLKVYGENLSLKEQVELYLIDCGLTMSEITTIRGFFLR